MIDRRRLMGVAAAGAGIAAVAAAAAQTGPAAPQKTAPRPLWPGRPPGSPAQLPRFRAEPKAFGDRRETWLYGIATPTIEIVRPARPNGVGLLAIPGGGYEFLAYTNEGTDAAALFAALGYTVAILVYRLPAEGWANRADVPLQDAQRALRLFRQSAEGQGLSRIGVLGNSAGGHLAGALATMAADEVYAPVDAADRMSARPDFAGLIYPVATLELPITHGGTRTNLLGADPAPALVAHRSPTRRLDANTPPSFVLHSVDDPVVPVDCALAWLAASRAAKVPVEAHLIERGGHGYSVHLPPDNPGALWPELFHRWIGMHAAGA